MELATLSLQTGAPVSVGTPECVRTCATTWCVLRARFCMRDLGMCCSACRGGLQVHEQRLIKTSRKIKLVLTGLLVAIFENLPLGILQIVYSQRISSKLSTIGMLSLVTSWLMLGRRMSAPSLLVELVKYKRKERLKVGTLKLLQDIPTERPGR